MIGRGPGGGNTPDRPGWGDGRIPSMECPRCGRRSEKGLADCPTCGNDPSPDPAEPVILPEEGDPIGKAWGIGLAISLVMLLGLLAMAYSLLVRKGSGSGSGPAVPGGATEGRHAPDPGRR
jgi:hypothetical protein